MEYMEIKNKKEINNNKKMKKAIMTTALLGVLSLTTLTGCSNYDFIDLNYSFNKAIMFGDGTATIVEIKK